MNQRRIHRREDALKAAREPGDRMADRRDFHLSIAVDRETGVILRFVESIGGEVTRQAEVVDFAPDAPLPPSAFAFVFPTGTTMLY